MKGQRAGNIRVSSETGDDSPMSNLLMSLLGMVVLIKERQREGIAVAQKRAYKVRKRLVDLSKVEAVITLAVAREKRAGLAFEFGFSRETFTSTYRPDMLSNPFGKFTRRDRDQIRPQENQAWENPTTRLASRI